MDLLFSYSQQKKDKNRKRDESVSQCLLRLHKHNDELTYEGVFEFDYDRYGKAQQITFEHNLVINLISGDVFIKYKIKNKKTRNKWINKRKKRIKNLVERCV